METGKKKLHNLANAGQKKRNSTADSRHIKTVRINLHVSFNKMKYI